MNIRVCCLSNFLKDVLIVYSVPSMDEQLMYEDILNPLEILLNGYD